MKVNVHITVAPDTSQTPQTQAQQDAHVLESVEMRSSNLVMGPDENVVEFGVRVAHELHLLATQ